MTGDSRFNLEAALAAITARLEQRFGEVVDSGVVEATVRHCAEGFVDAQVMDFVPMLVERYSRDHLTVMVPLKELMARGSEASVS